MLKVWVFFKTVKCLKMKYWLIKNWRLYIKKGLMLKRLVSTWVKRYERFKNITLPIWPINGTLRISCTPNYGFELNLLVLYSVTLCRPEISKYKLPWWMFNFLEGTLYQSWENNPFFYLEDQEPPGENKIFKNMSQFFIVYKHKLF